MTIESSLAFALAILILAASPGPGVFATVTKGIASGFLASLYMVFGIITGDFIFMTLAFFGLTAIAGIMGDFFIIIRIAGGLYLIYMGISLFRSGKGISLENKKCNGTDPFHNYVTGLLLTLGNPKAIIFYVSFLPTFIDLSALSLKDYMLSVGIMSGVLGSVLAFYGFSASRAKKIFSSDQSVKRLNRSAGTVMVGTGAFICTR